MIQTINRYDFQDAFNKSDTYKNSFSYEGRDALFEYLENYEEETGEQIELDIVALACEYTEYENAIDAASGYFEFEGMTYGEDGEELETREQVEEKALEFLRDRTRVIVFDGGVIIQDF